MSNSNAFESEAKCIFAFRFRNLVLQIVTKESVQKEQKIVCYVQSI